MTSKRKSTDGVVISIPYEPRPLQKEIHQSLWSNSGTKRNRFACLAIHRRFGKSVFAINELIIGAIQFRDLQRALGTPFKRFKGFYIAPTYKQAKSIAWEYLKEFTRDISGMRYMETELTAIFPDFLGGARIQLLGAENFESMRGNYIDACVLDEWGNMNPQIWREVIRPALADRKGWVIFLGTPNGKNHFYDTYQEAKNTEGWLARTYSVEETKLIDEEELQAARNTMGESEYRQEFLCDWQAAVRGSYYTAETKRLRSEGRFCHVPHASVLPVDLSFDLGMDDATAIWFFQQVNQEIRAIKYKEFKNTSLQEILKELSREGYIYGTAILPHDAKVRELSTGKTRIETVEECGLFQNVETVARQSVADGINAVRQIFPQLYIDETHCAEGFDCLENYRKKYDAKTGEYLDKPVHDQFSHGADSMRYYALYHHPDLGQVRERLIQNMHVTPNRQRRVLTRHRVHRAGSIYQ